MVENIEKLKDIISSPKNILITSHRNPDGDAIGSSMSLYYFLKKIGHKVSVIMPNSYPDFLQPFTKEKVINFDQNKDKVISILKTVDVIFMLDMNNMSRLADLSIFVEESNAIKILIDHHQEPKLNIANYIFSDPNISSTCELLYKIIDLMQMKKYFDSLIAECIYLGIMTDTGSFKFKSTTAKTHFILSDLINYGADNYKIHELIYDNNSQSRMHLLGYCLNKKLILYPEHNSAIISLTEDELNSFNFKKGDTEGFVNYALSIKGINFVAFIIEKDNVVKLSLRSKGSLCVNKIAKQHFNGGGHTNASGGTSYLSVNETIMDVERIIKTI